MLVLNNLNINLTESWNGLGYKGHLVPTPAVGRDTFHWTELLQTLP